ncbi:MAG: ABC transporter permease subunit [Gemmataceae bacterium]
MATGAALAPAAAAALAFAAHLFLPDRQLAPLTWMDALPAWRHPYSMALLIVVVLSLAGAAIQAVWPPLRRPARHYGPLLAGAVVVAAFWDLITQKLNAMRLPYFPGPDLVFGALVEDQALLLKSAGHSLLLLLSGYGLGALAGVTIGILIGWFARARYWMMPAIKLIGPLPATALVPLAMTLSNDSFLPATALIAFAVWFPVTMLTASGVAAVRLSYLDVARTLGAGQWYLVRHVAIPAALPQIFIGLFMGLGAAFLTLIAAETVGVQAGLGWYVKWRQGFGMEYANVYAALLLMSVFFSALMTLLFRLRDYALKWQKGIIQW